MVATPKTFPLLAELLAEQQRLDTPVARFSAAHDAASPGTTAIAPQLIPLTAPRPGEQYAFEVDLDACTGCKSCVAACHALNGLDDTETWRDVGLLVSQSRAHPFTQTVTTACHHCADPACLNGCPVLAYEKDPVTGIVAHLDDQCIGCSYCVLKCPYDVPKYSERLGIVRKCDLCRGRLAEGEAPACAQACPTHAIRIVTVAVETGNRRPETGSWKVETRNQRAEIRDRKPESGDRTSETDLALPRIAEAPPTSIEDPSKPRPGFRPPVSGFRSPVSGSPTPVSGLRFPVSDFLPAAPDPSYTRPTTRYVTKRRMPASLVAGDASILRVQPAHAPLVVMLTLIPVAVGLSVHGALAGPEAGATAALASWIAGAAGLAASVLHLGQPRRAWRIFLGWRRSWLSREAMIFGAWFPLAGATLRWPMLAPASAAVGLAGLACSAMIYIDTHRRFWRAGQTIPRFFGTAALVPAALGWPALAAVLLLAKLAWESRTHFDASVSSRLLRGPLARISGLRDLLGLAAFVLLLLAPPLVALAPLLVGEFVERWLFFRAVDAPKMPGMPA